MNQKDLTTTFMMILKWLNTFGLCILQIEFSALRVKPVVFTFVAKSAFLFVRQTRKFDKKWALNAGHMLYSNCANASSFYWLPVVTWGRETQLSE